MASGLLLSEVRFDRQLEGVWTFMQTQRSLKVRERVMRLAVVRSHSRDRGDLRVGLRLGAGSHMRHLRSSRRKNTAKQELVG